MNYFKLFAISLLVAFFSGLNAQSVYKTPSGNRYHLYECRMVDNVSKKLSLREAAKEYGLSPCKICTPPTYHGQNLNPDRRNKATGKCTSVRCKGYAKSAGRQCLRYTKMCNGYCFQHNPRNDDHSTARRKSNKPSTSSKCGARTKSGGYCRRKVKGGGRCYQHK